MSRWDDCGTGIELPAFLNVLYTNRELVLGLLSEDKGTNKHRTFRVGKRKGEPCVYYVPNRDEPLCPHGVPLKLDDCEECEG